MQSQITVQSQISDAQPVLGAPSIFQALCDPVRWAIVQRLAREGEVARADIEDDLTVARPTVSYHVRELVDAQLITVRVDGRNHFYRLRPEALSAAVAGVAVLVGTSSRQVTRRRAA